MMEGFVMPTIAAFCCVMAIGVRHAFPSDRMHDFIPLGCAVVGTVLACAFLGWSLDSLCTGAVSGFAATGLWEQATHIMPNGFTDEG